MADQERAKEITQRFYYYYLFLLLLLLLLLLTLTGIPREFCFSALRIDSPTPSPKRSWGV